SAVNALSTVRKLIPLPPRLRLRACPNALFVFRVHVDISPSRRPTFAAWAVGDAGALGRPARRPGSSMRVVITKPPPVQSPPARIFSTPSAALGIAIHRPYPQNDTSPI